MKISTKLVGVFCASAVLLSGCFKSCGPVAAPMEEPVAYKGENYKGEAPLVVAKGTKVEHSRCKCHRKGHHHKKCAKKHHHDIFKKKTEDKLDNNADKQTTQTNNNNSLQDGSNGQSSSED